MVLTSPLWCQKVKVLDVLPESLHILMDCIRSHTAYLDQSIVLKHFLKHLIDQSSLYLYEDCVTGQVPVYDCWRAAVEIGEGR